MTSNLRRSGWRTAAFLAGLTLLPGCATPYKPRNGGDGYADFRITEDTWSVTFKGNVATHEDTVELYMLRRAAELTLNHGYRYFVVVEEKGRTRRGSVGYSGLEVPVVSPGEAIEIQAYTERPDQPDRQVIDAARFLKYNFPKEYPELPEVKEEAEWSSESAPPSEGLSDTGADSGNSSGGG